MALSTQPGTVVVDFGNGKENILSASRESMMAEKTAQ
jgi:hypothetical protein